MASLTKPTEGNLDWSGAVNQNWTDIENAMNAALTVGTGGTGTSVAFTPGSIVFAGAGGIYNQDNAGLFWDDANNRLGIGTSTPVYRLHLSESSAGTSPQVHIRQSGVGDAAMRFALAGTRSYAFGIDNSDGDKLKISTAASASAVLGTGDLLTFDSDGNMVPGSAALNLFTYDGYIHNVTCQGSPRGTPNFPNRYTTIIDRDNNRFFLCSGGLWIDICPDPEKRQFSVSQNGLSTSFDILNGTAGGVTAEGTASALSDSTGTYINYASAATTNSDAGWVMGSADWLQRQLKPITHFIVKTGANATDIQTCRIWVGFFSGDPMASDAPSLHYAAFRYAPASDGTVYWRAVTDDGNASPTVTATTTPIAANTRYRMRIDMTDASNVLFFIDDVLVATHSTNLPGTTTNLGACAEIRTLENVAKNMRISRVSGESN
jgi:hypothetical protein